MKTHEISWHLACALLRLCVEAANRFSADPQHPGEIVTNHWIFWPQLHGGFQARDRFVEPAMQRQQLSYEMVRIRTARIQRKSTPGLVERLIQPAGIEQRGCQVQPCAGISIVIAERASKRCDRVVEFPRLR